MTRPAVLIAFNNDVLDSMLLCSGWPLLPASNPGRELGAVAGVFPWENQASSDRHRVWPEVVLYGE
jgi:hypothetical protein